MSLRLRPATFRGRLAASMIALTIAVLAIAAVLIYAGVRRTLLVNLDDTLLTIVRTEIASEFDEPGVGVHVHDPSAALAVPNRSGYDKFARVTDADGRTLAATGNLRSDPPLGDDVTARREAAGGHVTFADLYRGGTRYRGVYHPVIAPDGAMLVALVALPIEPVARALRALTGGLVIAIVVVGLAAGWGANRIARRLTSPLEHIAAAARSIRGEKLGTRIPAVSADAELRALTDILNDMLAAIEAALAAEREAVAAQQRFIADASHELRSPLANLRGTIEVTLRRPRTAAEYQETLGVAAREVERLSRLAEELLTLSRIDSGRLALRQVPCDLAVIAADAVGACRSRAAERDVAVALDAPDSVAWRGDPDRIRQVLDNLIDNALRHAPSASTVTVRAGRQNGAPTVAVSDRGSGIPPEDRAHVFERFYRADRSRSRDSGGLGLGLAIAKAIVEGHGGRLDVESTPGGGATFVARFAAADDPFRATAS